MDLSSIADVAKRSSAVAPDSDTAAGLAAKKANIDEYNAATKPAPEPVREPSNSPSDKVNPKARYGSRPEAGEKRIDTSRMTKALGSLEKGTPHVPKTGVYKLHEGEAVIPKDKNMADVKDKMMASLSGDEKKPKKEIKEMVHHKSTNGKHIVVHKHHHPEHHPDEEHALNDMAALHQHMEDHAGTPNDGEGPESAPQGAAPAQMTAAPSPAPAPSPTPGQ